MQQITITFDNGPDPETTPEVLKVLARHNTLATFFVLGDKLRDPSRRKICEQAKDAGHWIGNHTFNHLTPLGQSIYDKAANLEIGKTQSLIADLTHERKFFRPFGGGGNLNTSLLNQQALNYLVDGGFTCVLWNVIAHDWANPEGWVEDALDLCNKEDWPLIVLHDITTDAMLRLDRFLSQLSDMGVPVVQDFPKNCVPIEQGKIVAPLDNIVAGD